MPLPRALFSRLEPAKLIYFRCNVSLARNTWRRSSVFRTHFRRDVGKESHLLASRDTGTLDVEHRRVGREKVEVVVVVVVWRRARIALGGTLESEASARWSARRVSWEISGPQS